MKIVLRWRHRLYIEHGRIRTAAQEALGLQPRVNMMITLNGDQLQEQLSGQGKLSLFAEAEGKFFLTVVDAQLEFLKDADGKITHVILHQSGRDQKAHRISDTVAERRDQAARRYPRGLRGELRRGHCKNRSDL